MARTRSSALRPPARRLQPLRPISQLTSRRSLVSQARDRGAMAVAAVRMDRAVEQEVAQVAGRRVR